MTTPIRIQVDHEGRIRLPEAILRALGQPQVVYLSHEPGAEVVRLGARDPEIVENEMILEEMAAINRGMSDEEYTRPVPPSMLSKGEPQDD
jgi:hypothetical protein